MLRAKRIAKRTGIVVLGVALGVTGCSAVYNAATSPEEHSGRSLAPSGRFVDAGGVLTHYERFGTQGPAIVLVGGFLEPSDTWDAVARDLGRNHRVFAMDLAGFGYSERSGHYLLADWQRQLDDFMRAVGVQHALLGGHSLGAGVVAAEALAHPGADRRHRPGRRRRAGERRRPGRAARPDRRSLPHEPPSASCWAGTGRCAEIIREAYAPDRVSVDAGELGALAPARCEVDGTEDALARMLSNGIQGVELRDLAQVRVPATVVFGQHDSSVPVSSGRRVAAVLHAPMTIIAGLRPPLADHASACGRGRDRGAASK